MTDESMDAARARGADTDDWGSTDGRGVIRRAVGLAPASAAGYAPHRIVETAAAAGFDFVGLRLDANPLGSPASGSSPSSVPGSAASCPALVAGAAETRRTASALAATGLEVLDVDGIVLDDPARRGEWLAALEAAAELGARIAAVTVAGPLGGSGGANRGSTRHETARAVDLVRAFATDALGMGIVPAVEPTTYGGLAALADAAALAREAECLVLPDALHYHRSGASPMDAAAVADVTVLLRLSDAPAAVPADRAGRLAETRGHRLLPGDGAADLAGFLAAFPGDLPVSVAVRHPELDRLGLEAAVRELYAAGRACLEAVTLPDSPALAGLV